jgi:hypothetical protein
MSEQPEREVLPEDLERILRDQSIIVPQDAAVFELIAQWKDAPTGTAAPLTAEEWEHAWSVTVKKLLAALAQVEQLTKERDEARELHEQAEVDTERKVSVAMRTKLEQAEAERVRLRKQNERRGRALELIADPDYTDIKQLKDVALRALADEENEAG